MSTLTINEVRGLMEAYQEVYAPQELTEEQVWEEVEIWVNDLLEEGYDLSEYTWEEMYEAYLEEQGGRRGAAVGNQNVYNFPTSPGGSRRGAAVGTRTPESNAPSITSGKYATPSQQVRFSTPAPSPTLKPGLGGNVLAAPAPRNSGTKPPSPAGRTPGVTPSPATRPAAVPAKPTGTAPAPKPSPKPAGSPMDKWSAANPKLAAAKAERDRTRGTSSTTNPLMKDMKSRLPAATPKAASSNTLSSAVAAASKPAAFNPSNTLSSTAAAASKPAAFNPPPKVKTTPTPAVAPKQTPVAPAGAPKTRAQVLGQSYEYNIFDTILEYLVAEGYADTNESALVIMANMSEEWRDSIVEQDSTDSMSDIRKRTQSAVETQRAGFPSPLAHIRGLQRAAQRSVDKLKPVKGS